MEREHVLRREGGKCHWCGIVLNTGKDDRNSDPSRFTVDHKKPLSKGGETSLKNCVACCRKCNITRVGGASQDGRSKGGLIGGPARAAALTPERRTEIARQAAAARWLKP